MSAPARPHSPFVAWPPELAIVAAGSSLGQEMSGVEKLPKIIMSGPMFTYLRQSDNIVLHGDAMPELCAPLHPTMVDPLRALLDEGSAVMSPAERASAVSAITHGISQQAYEHAMAGRTVLTLGGDHSVSIGSVCGVSKAVGDRSGGQKQLGVICVGAHADIEMLNFFRNENMQPKSMALMSGLTAGTASGLFDWIDQKHLISPDKLVFMYVMQTHSLLSRLHLLTLYWDSGIQDVTDAEVATIARYNIKNFRPYDITHLGVNKVMDEALRYLGPDTPVHLCFDVRGLDAYVAPSTGRPTLDGLTIREGSYICERLSTSGQLVSMDVVEVNTTRGTERDKNRTLDAVASIIMAGLKGIY